MNTDAVNKYRKKHRRCKTCIHASNSNAGWYCKAKHKRHIYSDVYETTIAGVFCKVYSPELIDGRR